jgi:hypothetical protein
MIQKIKPSTEKYFEILLKLNNRKIESEGDKLTIGIFDESNFKDVKENLNNTIDGILNFFNIKSKSKDILDTGKLYACNIEIEEKKGESVSTEIADGLIGEPKYFAFIINKGDISSINLAELIGLYINYASKFFDCKKSFFASGSDGSIRKIGFILEANEPIKLSYII